MTTALQAGECSYVFSGPMDDSLIAQGWRAARLVG